MENEVIAGVAVRHLVDAEWDFMPDGDETITCDVLLSDSGPWPLAPGDEVYGAFVEVTWLNATWRVAVVWADEGFVTATCEWPDQGRNYKFLSSDELALKRYSRLCDSDAYDNIVRMIARDFGVSCDSEVVANLMSVITDMALMHCGYSEPIEAGVILIRLCMDDRLSVDTLDAIYTYLSVFANGTDGLDMNGNEVPF